MAANGHLRLHEDDQEDMETQLKLYEMIFAAVQPMSLRTAVLLNIPDIIATKSHGSNSLSVEEIASHISSANVKSPHMENLHRILRFLASTGVFTETVVSEDFKQCRYGLTRLSALLVKKGSNKRSFSPLLLLQTHPVYREPWNYLYDSVMEGCHAFKKCHGMNAWEYASKHPEVNQVFNDGMASDSRAVLSSVLKNYDGFKYVNTVVDVGGGVGSAISQIVNKYNHIRGINYDLPHVLATAPPKHGVQHVGGDMFEHIPSADAVFMKWILHDWDDEQCVKLLKNCHKAIPMNGKVIIVDAIVDGEGSKSRHLGLVFDMVMMSVMPGGKERTEEGFKQLFLASGFKTYRTIKLPLMQSIIEVVK